MYDHTKIESNWKSKWFENNIYKAIDFSNKPKKYILAELPYPSGKFLHAGHMMRYTVPEIYSRFLRMTGHNVMFPMGWDSFGLPAETFAIKNGITPKEAIDIAKTEFKKSMQAMGYAIDWDREFTTSEPDYYKWTQWIFSKLYEKGLVELTEMPAWWCEELGVLADEEVLPDPNNPGKKISERGDYPVQRKNTKQWVLKITDYADKLLEGLEEVDFPESIKNAQRNWIGKNVGINIEYPVENSDDFIKCFTTHPDTNFGATFIVLAPEHPLAEKLAKESIDVANYIEQSKQKAELERLENKEKTGVFTGRYALNRLNNKKLPIWVADYVLGHYGTGAVVGVPAHDDRDYEFAKKFDLEIIKVVEDPNGTNNEPFTEYGVSINSDFITGLESKEAIKKVSEFIIEKGWGEPQTTYKLRDQIWSRQRYWGDPIPLVQKQDGSYELVKDLPVVLPEITEKQAEKAKELKEFPSLDQFDDWEKTTDSSGNPAKKETDTMPTWAGSNWYYLRYIDPNNDNSFGDSDKLKYWLPVDKYFGGSEHTTVHLLYSRFWHRFLYDNGLVPTKEPYAQRINGGLLLGPDSRKMSKRWGNVINPQDLIENYGADATRTYIAFLGPYTDTYPWDNNGIKACYRFLKNVYELRNKVSDEKDNIDVQKAYNKMIKNMTSMLTDLKMNTGVSELMIFSNLLKDVDYINRETYLGFIKALAPYAPFITEEIWQEINGFKQWTVENSIHMQPWPTFDESLTIDDVILVPVQVNGKLRSEIEIKADASEEEVRELALKEEKVIKYIGDEDIKKFIYIKGKIVNIVV